MLTMFRFIETRIDKIFDIGVINNELHRCIVTNWLSRVICLLQGLPGIEMRTIWFNHHK